MANNLSPLSPKSKAANKNKLVSKNRAKNKSRNNAGNTSKSQHIQETVVNVILPESKEKDTHHHHHHPHSHHHHCNPGYNPYW